MTTGRSQASEQSHTRAVRFAIPATDSQIAYITDLGGKVKPDLTIGEANQYIRALKRKNSKHWHRDARIAVEAKAAAARAAVA